MIFNLYSKKNKFFKIIIIMLLCNVYLCYTQNNNYSIISVDTISIDGFKIGNDINKCKLILGNPKEYKEYTDPFPVDGYGKKYYLKYDSLNISFIQFYNSIILSSIEIRSKKTKIFLGKKYIKVGDDISKLSNYKESYNYYTVPKKMKEERIYFNIKYINNGELNYGFLNILIKENKIIEILFRLDEGT